MRQIADGCDRVAIDADVGALPWRTRAIDDEAVRDDEVVLRSCWVTGLLGY
jgi:hypothetical protein